MKTYGTQGGKITIAATSRALVARRAKAARSRARKDARKLITREVQDLACQK